MSYDAFLQVMSQLSGARRARCVVKNQIIFIDNVSEKNRWALTAKVFDGEGYLPPSVRDCLSSSGRLRWQEKSAYLRLDDISKTIFLVHEIDSTRRYIPFRFYLRDFAELAEEWHLMFDDLAASDLTGSV